MSNVESRAVDCREYKCRLPVDISMQSTLVGSRSPVRHLKGTSIRVEPFNHDILRNVIMEAKAAKDQTLSLVEKSHRPLGCPSFLGILNIAAIMRSCEFM